MPISLVIEEREGGEVAYIGLNRPAKLNALNQETVIALRDAVSPLCQRADLRVLVLTGTGERAFSTGADITELSQFTPTEARRFITALHEAHSALRALPVPVICRINGYCLGAGLEMAASCDIRVAVDTAIMGMPEVQVGLPSVIEAALLPRLIGWGRTNELLMTGTPISAHQALSWGLVESLSCAGELDRAVEQRVTAILKAGALAVRAQKKLMREWETLPIEQAIERGIEYLAQAYETQEPRQLMDTDKR